MSTCDVAHFDSGDVFFIYDVTHFDPADVLAILRGIERGIGRLRAYGIEPDEVKLTKAQYEAIKAHFTFELAYEAPSQSPTLMGLKIIVE